MKKTCLDCKGKGYQVTSYQICQSCHGTGVDDQVDLQDHVKGLPKSARERYQLDVDEEVPCPVCKGKGEVEVTETCPSCEGQGELNYCQKCGKQIERGNYCGDCQSKQVVYQLHPASDIGDLEVGAVYKGKVTKVVDFGVFVTFTKKVYGLMRMRASSYQVGDDVFARVTEIKTHRGEVDLEPARIAGAYHLCPAGIERGFKNAIAGADSALVVTTPEVSAIRDADRVVGLLEANFAERYPPGHQPSDS